MVAIRLSSMPATIFGTFLPDHDRDDDQHRQRDEHRRGDAHERHFVMQLGGPGMLHRLDCLTVSHVPALP